MRRVVVSGMGIYSCIGKNITEVTMSLREGKSGIGIDTKRTDYGYRSPLTGIVERPDLKQLLDRRARIGLAEESEYAYMATSEAIKSAGLDEQYFDNNEVGVIFGNDSSAKAIIDGHMKMLEEKDSIMLGSGTVFQQMNSTVTMNLATIFKLRGINFTVSAACSSSSHAIGLGLMFIRQGCQDMVICGGAQETNYLSMSGFDAISAFSINISNPAGASRPFDRDRDGLVPSGGSACVILEEYEHALKRGAKIYGEVVGYGFSSNGKNISQPDIIGSTVAIKRALLDANMLANNVDYINAHATSTPQGDMIEALAIDNVFGQYHTPVSSTKSMTGHECWMAGASEVVYSIIMMQNSFIAPNINFINPDEYSSKLNIVTIPIERELNVILSNSFGFGGTNSVLIIKKLT